MDNGRRGCVVRSCRAQIINRVEAQFWQSAVYYGITPQEARPLASDVPTCAFEDADCAVGVASAVNGFSEKLQGPLWERACTEEGSGDVGVSSVRFPPCYDSICSTVIPPRSWLRFWTEGPASLWIELCFCWVSLWELLCLRSLGADNFNVDLRESFLDSWVVAVLWTSCIHARGNESRGSHHWHLVWGARCDLR